MTRGRGIDGWCWCCRILDYIELCWMVIHHSVTKSCMSYSSTSDLYCWMIVYQIGQIWMVFWWFTSPPPLFPLCLFSSVPCSVLLASTGGGRIHFTLFYHISVFSMRRLFFFFHQSRLPESDTSCSLHLFFLFTFTDPLFLSQYLYKITITRHLLQYSN